MKPQKILPLLMATVLVLTACTVPDTTVTQMDGVQIVLSDDGVTADGKPVGTDETQSVYTANDIIYYQSGKDFTYGDGSEADAHTAQEAQAHTVVHISKPGTYCLSGKLSLGQIAVDLGDDAKDDPEAVVTLILNGVEITCEVAPAVIFYNVYECGSDDAENATKDVDTSAAGANVVIADGTVNTVNGSYVAKIYKPDSVVLNEEKTQVEEAKKLHKYDGAFYSKRSMNIYGGAENTGVLNINAENEGLDSELHLTVHGGNVHIASGNDGINTNEDNVSVTTVNGGKLTILVTGETGEGDGIDSNGWLVINGGTVMAAACAKSADAGIDSDMGIHINGGTVIASGHMLDRIEDGGQTYAVFQFAQKQSGSETVTLKDQSGKAVMEAKPENAYSVLIYSSPDLKAGTYTLWNDDKQLAGATGGMMGGPGMQPDGTDRPELPGDMQKGEEERQLPEGVTPPQAGTRPEDFTPPEGFTPPEDGKWQEMPEGNGRNPFGGGMFGTQELSPEFVITDGGNMFGGISLYEENIIEKSPVEDSTGVIFISLSGIC